MAGNSNSGGNRRLSDAEKIARGTFRKDQSEEVYAARAGAKVITGVFLPRIPDPSIPLSEVGRGKYDELTNLLFEQNKLTVVTCGDCERMAVMHQQMHERLSAGKNVPMDLIKRMDAISLRLRIAENAPTIADPTAKNKFANCGFSSSKVHTVGLRSYRSSGDDL